MLEINVEGTKKDIRNMFLKKRMDLEPKSVMEQSKTVCENVKKNKMFIKANSIMVYMPFKNEVDIREIIESAWSLNKKILLPKVNTKNKSMEPYLVNSWEDIELGSYNIYEPKENGQEPYPIEEIELVLVPGVAFDMRGYRLGYGGGYYDRFFDRFYTTPYKIGIAYDFQLVKELPNSSHDYKVNEVLTELNNIVF